jgi:hypothetical protein
MSIRSTYLVFPDQLLLFFEHQLADMQEGDALVPGADQQALNTLLVEICDPPATTYSFRRNFMHRILQRCTINGEVDYAQAMRYTIHEQESTLRARYERHVSDTPRTRPTWWGRRMRMQMQKKRVLRSCWHQMQKRCLGFAGTEKPLEVRCSQHRQSRSSFGKPRCDDRERNLSLRFCRNEGRSGWRISCNST